MTQNPGTERRATDSDELWRKISHTDAQVAGVKVQVDSMSISLARIEQALLNRPGVNWVALVGMVVGVMTLVGSAFFLMLSQVSLMLEPIVDDVGDNSSTIEELRQDVRDLVSDTAVHGEQINRIDTYGSSNWIDFRRRNFSDRAPDDR